MSIVRELAIVILLPVGALFFLAGTLGLLRLPDCYARIHAVSKCDTMGAGAILFALALLVAPDSQALKILVLLALVLLSSPTSGHALARAAHLTGLTPWSRGNGGSQ
jgi:monovalent cation/proton antiporter MnhG/PhaG subunit